MTKWISITKKQYRDNLFDIKYVVMASGRMLGGGVYTEWTPYSALVPRYPDLRFELGIDGTEKHYVLAAHDPRD